jgi:hypothetical protein
MIPNIKKGINSFFIKATSCEFEVGSGFIRLDDKFYCFRGTLNQVYEQGNCFIIEIELKEDFELEVPIYKWKLFCMNPKHYLLDVAKKIAAKIMELEEISKIRREYFLV